MKLKRLILSVLIGVFLIAAYGCVIDEPGVDPPKQAIYFPVGLALHPSHNFAVVVNANFNLSYKNGSISVIDLRAIPESAESGHSRIVASWTIPIGSFGAMAAFNSTGTQLYVAVRGERKETETTSPIEQNTLYVFDVDANASPDDGKFLSEPRAVPLAEDPFGVAVSANNRFVFTSHLSNGEVSIVQTTIGVPVDPTKKEQFFQYSKYEKQGNTFISKKWCLPADWTCDGHSGTTNCSTCTNDTSCGTNGMCLQAVHDPAHGKFCTTECIEDSDCGEGFLCLPLRPDIRITERKFEPGLNGIAIHPQTGAVYATSKYSRNIDTLHTYYQQGRITEAFTSSFTAAESENIRGLAFATAPANSPSNITTMLFAATRNSNEDPGITVIDVSEDPSQFDMRTGMGMEKNLPIDFIPTCASPSDVQIAAGLMFVSCFGADRVVVFDLNSWEMIDEIVVATTDTDREMAPYKMVAFENSYTDSSSGEQKSELLLLVAMFKGHEIQLWRINRDEAKKPHELLLRIQNHAIEYK